MKRDLGQGKARAAKHLTAVKNNFKMVSPKLIRFIGFSLPAQ